MERNSSTSSASAPSEYRWHLIDVLRGLSILAVILLHINGRIPFGKSAIGAHIPKLVDRILFHSGYYGVKVFFVISGFLISANIFRRWGALDGVDLKIFYKLRFSRIMPSLLALLAILAIMHMVQLNGFVINPKRASLPRALFAALTFHLNVLEIQVGYLPASWDVLWSLSVEEGFYLIYPLLCRYSPRRWFLAAVGLVFVAAGPLARTVWAGGNELAEDKAYLSGFDCIALGCIAATASHLWKVSGVWQLIIRGVGLLLMIQVSIYSFIPNLHLGRMGLDVSALALGAALFLWSLDSAGLSTIWMRPFEWFGRHSYETYLTHSFVVVLGTQVFVALGSNPNAAPWWHVAMIAISGLLGWAVARYYSEPMNRVLRRLPWPNQPDSRLVRQG